MKRRIAGIAVTVLMAGGLLAASQVSTAGAVTTLDLRLKESLCGQDGTHCKFLNHDKGVFGDTLIFSLPLTNRDDGQRAGRDEGECITLHEKSRRYYCSFVAHLKEGGDLAVQGIVDLSQGAASVLPITGGTGAYEGASGSWEQDGRKVIAHVLLP